VNAAGPWVANVLAGTIGLNTTQKVRMVKGSHLVLRRLYDHDRCYIFQNADRRICFTIPYEEDFSLVGTTDEEFQGDPAAATISEAETDYLLGAVNEYLRTPATRADIAWSYAGVRPLFDDGASKAQEATRDYVLTVDASDGVPPLLSVFGGKITTFRRLAEAALAKLARFFPAARGPWTASAALPGGDFPHDGAAGLAAGLRGDFPWLEATNSRRLVRRYGTLARAMLDGARSAADMGRDFGAGLTEREVRWLMDREWAREADDVLWRRTRLGLRFSRDQHDALGAFMATR
jgi:glycerol-3-phosphate dehydrogenase